MVDNVTILHSTFSSHKIGSWNQLVTKGFIHKCLYNTNFNKNAAILLECWKQLVTKGIIYNHITNWEYYWKVKTYKWLRNLFIVRTIVKQKMSLFYFVALAFQTQSWELKTLNVKLIEFEKEGKQFMFLSG